jgi:small multidrug resistance pump
MAAVLFLAGAIASEVVGTLFLRASEGFSRLWPSLGTVAGYALSFALLAQALRSIDVGIAYAVWAGVGTALVTIIGMIALGEPATALKFAGAALVVVGVVILNLSGGAH